VIRAILRALLVVMPWPLRRRLLVAAFGYRIDPSARIGLAWVYPERLSMGPGSSIGHLTVCKGLAAVSLGAHASIGRGNWITGFPAGDARHFAHRTDRRPELQVGEHAAITNRHIVDCTDLVEIGAYATFAGFRSQILTHSIDLLANRQSCAPVRIGRYCFVGTGCTVLAGSVLPDHSVLGAASLLNRAHEQRYTLYAGVPAEPRRPLDPSLAYFARERGFVD
jgi:acetyltransferase-like isoleucine patch superfamily enzyme